MELAEAANRMTAVRRGQLARSRTFATLHEKHAAAREVEIIAAAARVQAVARGRHVRVSKRARQAEVGPRDAQAAASTREHAAARETQQVEARKAQLGAQVAAAVYVVNAAAGCVARVVTRPGAEYQAAATRVQAATRGRRSRLELRVRKQSAVRALAEAAAGAPHEWMVEGAPSPSPNAEVRAFAEAAVSCHPWRHGRTLFSLSADACLLQAVAPHEWVVMEGAAAATAAELSATAAQLEMELLAEAQQSPSNPLTCDLAGFLLATPATSCRWRSCTSRVRRRGAPRRRRRRGGRRR